MLCQTTDKYVSNIFLLLVFYLLPTNALRRGPLSSRSKPFWSSLKLERLPFWCICTWPPPEVLRENITPPGSLSGSAGAVVARCADGDVGSANGDGDGAVVD